MLYTSFAHGPVAMHTRKYFYLLKLLY